MEAALKINHCHKRFPGVYALKDVSIEAFQGEAVALLGVNGAGKSTLMNVLGGVLSADEGEILIHNKPVQIRTPGDSRACGIAFIQQEVQLFDNLTVFENIFLLELKNYRKMSYLPVLDKKKLCEKSEALLKPLGCYVDPGKKVSELSVGEQQIVQIARALSLGGEILLFDEPTSSLSMKEKENLFEIIRKLKESGKTIIYITHYLDEVEIICDRVIVMRDGQVVGRGKVSEVSKEMIVNYMVPSKMIFSSVDSQMTDEVVLRVENLRGQKNPKGLSFDLHKGEVLGLWGLLGSGRTETIQALLGLEPIESGRILYREKGNLKPISPKKLFKKCGYVTEGRHYDGLYLSRTLWQNTTGANLKGFSSRFLKILNSKKEKEEGRKYMHELHIAAAGEEALAMQLSGGNQQKVVISKWLCKNPEILILDEPTRGVDVGAKVEIQNLIRQLASKGMSCIVVSSETEEIQNLADNILVLREGYAGAYLQGEEINNQRLIKECIPNNTQAGDII
ncbi:MAG: sugar ABC transporter ATP-binding protein [Lachnoclostridium edouardi]|uniref:sugar ABC transporter ATP-binding protein n=1 Tax=Lachnoclostridium edouardi TaxID=1926283 RepID=UPI0026DAD182|nr:sugar ABC transporter ATP-binding protein [Lachnoclostridium edouardi]MDO4279727.1 sugar ABC transporter ATP-binding protein [Lachnoclostridium edouardi]